MIAADELPALSIERIAVRADRIVCDVILSPLISDTTTPELMRKVCAVIPSLPRHACVNEVGNTFGDVMNNTSLPHLLEHLVIDAQMREMARLSQEPLSTIYTGTTEWVDRSKGRARIEVSFTDDLVALRVFKNMTSFLCSMVVP